jgi:hypothetical protein
LATARPAPHPVLSAVADHYALELQALAASLTTPAGPDSDDGPTLLTLDQAASELLLAFERDLEPRLAAGSGDLAHLAGWAAKLAGATCRLAGLLHLASHLHDGWARPIAADTFAGAIRLAGYLVDHARAVFDLMGADPAPTTPAGCSTGSPARTGASSAAATPTRPPPRPLPQGHRLGAGLAPAGGARLPPPRRRRPTWPQGRPTALAAVPGQPPATRHRTHRTYRTYKTQPAQRFCGFCRFCARGDTPGSR